MGRGASKAGKGGGGMTQQAQREQIVTDNYGRQVVVIPNANQLPPDRQIWPSGAFEKNGDYYAVFARINNTSVDPNSLVGIKVMQSDMLAISGIGGWQSWTTSKQADSYVKRYDKPGAKPATMRRVNRAIAFSNAMKKFGL